MLTKRQQATNQARIPRMRTINEAAEELRALDPNTAITANHIRRLCLTGVLPTIKAGKKILFDFSSLIEYLEDPTADKFQPRPATTVNGIRRNG